MVIRANLLDVLFFCTQVLACSNGCTCLGTMNKNSQKSEFKSTLLIIGYEYGLFAIACIIATAFLIFDIILPLGVAAGVSYVAVVLFALWFPSLRQIIMITLYSIILIIIGYILSPEGGTLWIVLLNRGLSLFAVITTGVVIYLLRKSNKNSSYLEQTHNSETQAGNISSTEAFNQSSNSYNLISTTGFRGLLMGFPILLLIVSVTFWVNQKNDESILWVSHTHDVRRSLLNVLSLLIDAETGQRGFLLTGSEKYLEPYTNAIKQLDIAVKELHRLTLDNPIQQANLDKIDPLMKEKFMELNETISLRKSGESDAATNIVNSGRGKNIMDQMRAIFTLMEAEEIMLLKERKAIIYKNNILAQSIGIIGFILLVIIGTLVVFRVRSLLISHDKAEKASNAKSLFLSSMSHELRTPLNAVLGFSQLIEMRAKDELTKHNSREIIDAGSHLLELIDEILDLTQIESGNVDLSIDSYSIKNIIKYCSSMVLPLADKSSIQIDNKISSISDVKINVDEKRFKQVVLNLLSNAIKYNNENGKIIIDYSLEYEGMLYLSITDTGKGLTLEQKNHIFIPFDRAGEEASNIPGSGLGLVISKTLIEKMNGTMGFESNIGEGSRFWIQVPLS